MQCQVILVLFWLMLLQRITWYDIKHLNYEIKDMSNWKALSLPLFRSFLHLFFSNFIGFSNHRTQLSFVSAPQLARQWNIEIIFQKKKKSVKNHINGAFLYLKFFLHMFHNTITKVFNSKNNLSTKQNIYEIWSFQTFPFSFARISWKI